VNLSVRQEAILRTIRRDGSVQVAEIAAVMGTSQMTIRRDLSVLTDQGEVDRVHGGAVLARPKRSGRGAAGPAPAPAPVRGGAPGPGAPRRRGIAFGMLVPGTSYHYQQMISSALAFADHLRIRLETGVFDPDPAAARARIGRLLACGADGLMLTPGRALSELPELMAWIRALPVPVVIVEHGPETAGEPGGFDHVTTNHEHGARQALDHLVQLGHRRIALLAAPTPAGAPILAGFTAACRALGLPEGPPRVLLGPQAGREAIEDFCDAVRASGATAALAHPDEVAVGVARALRARDLAVPDRFALVAQGDEYAEFDAVPITGIAPPRAALGRTALTRLMQAVAEGEARITQHTYLSPTLHARASTLPPRPGPAPGAREPATALADDER
jgi:DNA-binding LacI/PurR family transcriptional regulator